MSTAIPSLSTQGWISTIEEKGDLALSYFITSEYSQSVIYHGKIASLQYLVKRYASDAMSLQTEVKNVLDGLMRRYFGDNVITEVRVIEHDSEKPGQLTINFSCTIRENGLEYSLGRRVEFLNGTLVKIAKLNNG